MKNPQKGSVLVTTLLVIIILLVLIIGFYVYRQNSPASTIVPVMIAQPTTKTSTVPVTSEKIAVAGMQQYTDAKFGFSFWYPTTWQVSTPTNPPFGVQTQGGTVVATLGLQPIGQSYPSIIVKEFHSPNRTITDTGGAGPIGPITYFFDPTTHLWMTSSDATGVPVTTTANISNNTMGGLHMFPGTSRFDTSIIPLSADNFVVISDGDGATAKSLEKTVVATDLSVATPVSMAEQIQTIKAEATAIANYKTN